MTPITLEVVRDITHLEQIKAEWARFLGTLERTSPYQLPEWQLTWWQHFGAGRLHIMLFRSFDALVGIVPCYLHNHQERRTLQMIGVGMADFLEPPILPGVRSDVTNLLKAHLLANPDWDFCYWQALEANSPLTSLQWNANFRVDVTPETRLSRLAIQGSFAQYWSSRSFALRRNFFKYLDSGNFSGRPRLEVVTRADPEFVNAVIRLHDHAGSWSTAKDGPAAFVGDLAHVLDVSQKLRIFGLRLNRKLLAVSLAFAHQNELHSFAAGQDPSVAEDNFERLLLFECLRYSFDNGYRGWNFARGAESEKLLWGAQAQATARVFVERLGSPSPRLQ